MEKSTETKNIMSFGGDSMNKRGSNNSIAARDLGATAKLIEFGLTPIPLGENSKRPIVQAWTSLPRDELLMLCENHVGNIGTRIERPFFVIDVDNRKLANLFLEEVPTTVLVETKRGLHIYLNAPDGHYPTNIKGCKLVQLLAEGSQVVSPPSVVDGHTYRYLQGPPDVGIAELAPRDLSRILKIIEAVAKHETLITTLAEVWNEGHRHNLALWLCGALRKAGIEKGAAAVIMKAICLLADDHEVPDRLTALKTTYEKPIDEVAGWSRLERELEQIVGLERAKAILALLPRGPHYEAEDVREEREDALERAPRREGRPHVRFTVGGEVVNGALIEIVETEQGPRLLTWDGASLQVLDEFAAPTGEVLRPVSPRNLRLTHLPRVPERVAEDLTLWRDTIEFIRDYFDHPDERVYHIMTAAVAWSYAVHLVRGSTPYLGFLGPWRSGKSRALEVLEAIVHRPKIWVKASDASIFRIIEILQPTLLLDELQHIDDDVRAILAAGYRYGATVPRVLDPEAEGLEGIREFQVFGLKVFASREEPPEDILSRTIVIHCEKNTRQTRKKIDETRAAELRTRWFAQRLRMFGNIAVTFEEFASSDGRLQELMSPLLVMAETFGGPEAKAAIEGYGREVERRIASLESTTDDAMVVAALIELVGERQGDAPETVSPSELAKRLNGEEEKGPWSPEKVGRRLSALGFERVKGAHGKRLYLINFERLGRLAKRYGL